MESKTEPELFCLSDCSNFPPAAYCRPSANLSNLLGACKGFLHLLFLCPADLRFSTLLSATHSEYQGVSLECKDFESKMTFFLWESVLG